MIWIILYVLGFVTSYLIFKNARNKFDANDWIDVGFNILFSLGSWLSAVAAIIMIQFIYLDYFEENEPPKWL